MRIRKGLHPQIHQIYYSVLNGIGRSKHGEKETNFAAGGRRQSDLIHSVKTRDAYLRNMHLFADFLQSQGESSIFDFSLENLERYLSGRITHFRKIRGSYGSFSQETAALSKLLVGIEKFCEERNLCEVIDFEAARSVIRAQQVEANQQIINPGLKYSKPGMTKEPWYHRMGSRCYERPEQMIAYIDNNAYYLQARIQLEGGCRAEGVGAPCSPVPNPFTAKNLRGLCPDPVNGEEVGSLYTTEKGGKGAFHFVSKDLYEDLFEYIEAYEKLASGYNQYLYALKKSAKKTGQYVSKRGTHGLRHNFAVRRFDECILNGYGELEAKSCVSKEMNHNRLDITDTYLGR